MLCVLSVATADFDCTVIRRGRTVLVLVSDRLLTAVGAVALTRALGEAGFDGDQRDDARAS